MSKPAIALVTAVAARAIDEDMPSLEAALRSAGADVTIAEWDRPQDWSRFDIAVLRSTWDYPQRFAEFMAWADAVSQQTTLLNPLTAVQWSCDKHYLAHLAAKKVPTVLTRFIEPDEVPAPRIEELLKLPDAEEFVVKPAVGAGSRDAQRYGREESEDAARHAERLLADQRSVLLQPYLNKVDVLGETALMYVEGQFSHAIRKGPLLKKKEAPTTELFAKEAITARVPDAAELRVGAQVLQALPFVMPLYARVDLIRDQQGAPVVLEVELIEPSLFLPFSAGSADRLAAAMVQRAKSSPA